MLQSIKKSKSGLKPGLIQPLSIVDLDVYEKPNSNLQRIKELKPSPALVQLHEDIVRKTVALFVIELLNYCLQSEEPDEELFDFVERKVLRLEQGENLALLPIDIMLGLTKHLGIEPTMNYSADNPYFDTRDGFYVSFESDNTLSSAISELLYLFQLGGQLQVSVNKRERRQLLEGLILYYQNHVLKNKYLKSLDILTTVLE
jgi:DNA repair protein RecO (recombination protein O)